MFSHWHINVWPNLKDIKLQVDFLNLSLCKVLCTFLWKTTLHIASAFFLNSYPSFPFLLTTAVSREGNHLVTKCQITGKIREIVKGVEENPSWQFHGQILPFHVAIQSDFTCAVRDLAAYLILCVHGVVSYTNDSPGKPAFCKMKKYQIMTEWQEYQHTHSVEI